MIRCHMARLMGERKMRISDVMRETGLSRTTVTLLLVVPYHTPVHDSAWPHGKERRHIIKRSCTSR